MNTLAIEARATKVWFDKNNIWLLLEDGRQVSAPLAFYPRLLRATGKQLKKYHLIGNGIGIHWEDIDEDLSVEGIILGRKDISNRVC
jgi:hypothetical protein